MDYIIRLKNGLSFIIIKKYVLDGEKYLYLVSDTDTPEFIFARYIDEKIIEPVQDKETFEKLMMLVVKELEDIKNNRG